MTRDKQKMRSDNRQNDLRNWRIIHMSFSETRLGREAPKEHWTGANLRCHVAVKDCKAILYCLQEENNGISNTQIHLFTG